MADIESTTVNSIDLYSIPAVLTVNTAVVDACTAASPREGAMIHLFQGGINTTLNQTCAHAAYCQLTTQGTYYPTTA